ncbi:MAG: KpsF/GutQ family sugar-phosphate isomerase [Planctomycetota bacterium]
MNRRESAIEVIEAELAAVRALLDHLDETFDTAVDLVLGCTGRVVASGMGKAGLIGEKISATLASTGTPSFFLHPAEAIHGDLGRLRPEDLLLLLSNSGETEEVIRLLEPARALGATLVAMTGAPESRLARFSDCHLSIGSAGEACPLGLAPTSSTTAMLVLGDALAMTVLREREFGPRDYARFHPGGSLGRRLTTVGELMRSGERNTLVPADASVRETLRAINATRGRPGAATVVAADGRLAGFVTDGDLVRALERGADVLERPISGIMVRSPRSIAPDRLASEAMGLMREHKIDQLPVLSEDGCPVGLVDVQDLIDAGIPS